MFFSFGSGAKFFGHLCYKVCISDLGLEQISITISKTIGSNYYYKQIIAACKEIHFLD